MRKQRTREHIIEDLGFNHIEWHVLHAGYTISRNGHNDYGYDGTIHTFNENGETENLMILFQLKSTDNIQYSQKKKAVKFDLSQQDLELCLKNPFLIQSLFKNYENILNIRKMRIPSKIFLEVSVSNNEFIKVLTQLGFKQEIKDDRFHFVNEKHSSIVNIPARPLEEPVQRIYISNYSYQLYMQGIIKDEEDLVKKVLQNRTKIKSVMSK